MTGYRLTAIAEETVSSGLSLEIVLWGICIGLMIGCVIAYIQRQALGRAVAALIRQEIFTPESAKTLSEIDCRANVLLRRALRPGKPMRKFLLCANEAEVTDHRPVSGFRRAMRRFFSLEEDAARFSVRDARFYIPAEQRYAAETRYDANGFTLPALIASLLVIGIATAAMLYVLPGVLSFFQPFLSAL